MQSNGEQWRFWAAVRAEMRATWWGRWRWLWLGIGSAYGFVLAVYAWFDLPYWEWDSTLSLALVCWPPAWLGSDLLSLRFAGNPDPLREWRPVEFLARLTGRLGPLLGIMGPLNLGTGPDPITLGGWLWDWSADVANGLCYAGVASLVSSHSKRPRRYLITILVLFGSYLLGQGLEGHGFHFSLDYVAAPSQGLWGSVYPWLAVLPWLGWRSPQIEWAAAGVFFIVAILAGLWTWWIAAHRYRRSRVSPGAE